MTRVLSYVVVLALGAALFFLPSARTADLAVLAAPDLLDAPRADGRKPTIWGGFVERRIVRGEEGHAELPLEAVEVRLDGDPVTDPATLDLARRSMARGLRQLATAADISLAIPGERGDPAPDGARFRVVYDDDELALEDRSAGRAVRSETPWTPPSRSSVFPPFVAIALAILLRRPVVALFAGTVTAGFLLQHATGSSVGVSLLAAVPRTVSDFFWPQVYDSGARELNTYRLQVIGFVVCMLAMVGIMTKAGGIRGVMDLVARLAAGVRSTQIATWLMGLVVFFDDYANCILVGSTMRPLADRYRISREKLSYLVDSTAAPVAGLSIFSTWIAYEVSTFSAQLPAAGLSTEDGYAVFIETLPFRFYCVLALFFGGLIAITGRDFGPMLEAERRARSTGRLVREGGRPMVADAATAMEPAPGVTARASRAIVPVVLFVGLTLVWIVREGWSAMSAENPALTFGDLLSIEGVTGLLAQGDSTHALQVGSFWGMLCAALFAAFAGLRHEILDAAWTTVRSMGIAIVILMLAWMIGKACEDLGTAPYLTVLLTDRLVPALLPVILFLLAAAIALATGSSWSTMSILLPLVVGLAFHLGETTAMGGHLLMVMSIGAVLEGAIFGDHCSPISDTTVLSSTATAADHIDHVRTQIPYALLTAVAALFVGYVPCAFFGTSPWVAMGLGALTLFVFLRLFGRRADAVPTATPSKVAQA